MDAVRDEDGAGGQQGHSKDSSEDRGCVEKGMASGKYEYHAHRQVQVFPVPVLDIVEHQSQNSEYLYDQKGGEEIIKARDEKRVASLVRCEGEENSHEQGQKQHSAEQCGKGFVIGVYSHEGEAEEDKDAQYLAEVCQPGQDQDIGLGLVQLLQDIYDGSYPVEVQGKQEDKEEEYLCPGVLQEELADEEHREYREKYGYGRNKDVRAHYHLSEGLRQVLGKIGQETYEAQDENCGENIEAGDDYIPFA